MTVNIFRAAFPGSSLFYGEAGLYNAGRRGVRLRVANASIAFAACAERIS